MLGGGERFLWLGYFVVRRVLGLYGVTSNFPLSVVGSRNFLWESVMLSNPLGFHVPPEQTPVRFLIFFYFYAQTNMLPYLWYAGIVELRYARSTI